MTKEELIVSVKKKTNGHLSKRLVEELIDETFTVVAKAIKKHKRFSYPKFGTFSVKKRKERKGRNPQTGEEILIKASKSVGFKPAPALKNKL